MPYWIFYQIKHNLTRMQKYNIMKESYPCWGFISFVEYFNKNHIKYVYDSAWKFFGWFMS